LRSLDEVARRLVWWTEPAQALADPRRFVAQVMVYGTAEDVVAAQAHFGQSMFRAVLSDPPPGLFDPRSWAYWHVVLGLGQPTARPHSRLSD
jgi:hypothetical protein